eukprot:CAMPEP_0173068458 /NCGR_PEP_ID=MMETSP1102-20130122/7421_1 /TAXON_ID=49646 /ORGANISM="Geminigera sp., Strain Caron Lab Isolate" /LENGTH=90 /DNA_ID=CAMNT_0013936315 /DNA_START=404 /DNA_END=676 /DNA_ORIENTATION=+
MRQDVAHAIQHQNNLEKQHEHPASRQGEEEREKEIAAPAHPVDFSWRESSGYAVALRDAVAAEGQLNHPNKNADDETQCGMREERDEKRP